MVSRLPDDFFDMDIIKDRSFYKKLFLLAIPIILQNLITYSVNLADNVMIGTLGDTAVSGVYMGTQVQTVLQVVTVGIEGGILLLAAQYWGKKDTASIKRIVKIGMTLSVSFGALIGIISAIMPEAVIGIFTNDADVIKSGAEYLGTVCFSYIFFSVTQGLITSMRTVESPRIGLAVSLVSLGVDVVLNYVLIFGKLGFEPMGVKGAATATVIARIAEFCVILIYVLFIDKKLRLITAASLKPSALVSFDRTLFRDYIKYGTPLVLGQLVWGTNLFSNSVILGHFGDEVITAVSIANTLNNLMYVGINGMASAVGIVTGKKVGAGDIDDIRRYARTVQLIFLCMGIGSFALLLGLRVPFISMYDVSSGAVNYAMQFIAILSITAIGTCYQMPCLFGLVKSGGDVSFVFKNDTVFVFGVVIPSAVVTSLLGAPAWVVFLCLKVDQILKCIVAFFKIRRYNWMKNLTRQ